VLRTVQGGRCNLARPRLLQSRGSGETCQGSHLQYATSSTSWTPTFLQLRETEEKINMTRERERERRMLTTQPGKSTYASAEEVGLALMSPLHLLHPLPTGASATEISSSSRSEVAAKARRRCPAPCGRRAHRRTVASVHGTQPLHPFLFFLLPLPGHRRSPGLSSRRCRSSRLYAPHRRSSRLSGLRRCCSLLLVVAVVRITRRTRFYRILTDG
jgi:hypothetical protein